MHPLALLNSSNDDFSKSSRLVSNTLKSQLIVLTSSGLLSAQSQCDEVQQVNVHWIEDIEEIFAKVAAAPALAIVQQQRDYCINHERCQGDGYLDNYLAF